MPVKPGKHKNKTLIPFVVLCNTRVSSESKKNLCCPLPTLNFKGGSVGRDFFLRIFHLHKQHITNSNFCAFNLFNKSHKCRWVLNLF